MDRATWLRAVALAGSFVVLAGGRSEASGKSIPHHGKTSAKGSNAGPRVSYAGPGHKALRGQTFPHHNRSFATSYSYQRSANQAHSRMVSSLRSTVSLLQRSDHDYDGHRVQAIHHLQGAIHSLQNTSNRNLTPTAYRGASARHRGANRMPQAASDANLRTALQNLSTIQGQMAQHGVGTRGVRANSHVQSAMRELNVALNIR